MIYPLSMLLIIANFVILIISAIRFFSKWLHWSVIGLLLISLLQLLIDGFYQTFILAYITTVILIIAGLYLWKRRTVKPRFRILKAIWAVLWRLIFAICLVLSIIFTWSFGKSDTFIKTLQTAFTSTDLSADYSNLGWSEAFEKMNTRLAEDYAFGEWKKINWNSLYEKYAEQIKAAEKANDHKAYSLALRKYVLSIPDNHVSIEGDDSGLIKNAIGGSFGFAVIQLDNGKVIAHIIDKNGPAYKKGMKWGAEILTWNNKPVLSAIEDVSLVWQSSPDATLEGKKISKLIYLTRAPVGTSVSVKFINPGESSARRSSLTSVEDKMETLYKNVFMGMPLPFVSFTSSSMKTVEWRILENGYGYVRIIGELPSLGDLNPVGTVRDAVKAFNSANVPGVVIDLRYNFGGIDKMAPRMMSHFVTEPMFYEKVASMDKETGKWKTEEELSLEPDTPNYAGPVAMLISNNTISTGEGFPLIMKTLKRGPVVGFYGTSASFGMAGATIVLPGGITVTYPNGASLDKDGNIQLDSNHLLEGGVLPDVRVPINKENLKGIFVDGRDIVLETAIDAMKKNK